MKDKIDFLKDLYRSRRLWFWGMLGILGVWGIFFFKYLPDGKLRIVFCDVGQGDGIYIDLPNGEDILIDGGPNNKVLECLGKNMPFWDKKLEMVVLTHAQADHLNGLVDVLGRYKVGVFVSSPIGNTTKGYKSLIKKIKDEKVKIKNVYAGDVIKMKNGGEVAFRVLWPSRKYVAAHLDKLPVTKISSQINSPPPLFLKKRGSPADGDSKQSYLSRLNSSQAVVESRSGLAQTTDSSEILSHGSFYVFGAKTSHSDLNDFSVVLELKFGEFEALFSGDADKEIQDDILGASDVVRVDVFKVPHHGSKFGILDEYLDKANPKLAVISVGKNRWGHPTKEALEKLKVRNMKFYRTDKDGDVKITTDGKQYWVESDRE